MSGLKRENRIWAGFANNKLSIVTENLSRLAAGLNFLLKKIQPQANPSQAA
jgi:hypothetical protein